MRLSRWLCLIASSGLFGYASAAKVTDVRTLDERRLTITIRDSEIVYQDDGKGPTALQGHESVGEDTVRRFGKPLDVVLGTKGTSFTVKSATDPNYRREVNPVKVYRRSKVNGTTGKWPEPEYAMEHVLYLEFAEPLKSGNSYEVSLDEATQADKLVHTFKFDVKSSVSEALHVNIIGYNPNHGVIKSADLYAWIGDGGAIDYSAYAGRDVNIVNAKTGRTQKVGTVKDWKKSGADLGGWNITKSDVWTCDFTGFNTPGRYRLYVDGIGCSPEFELSDEIYRAPYRTSLLGFFYMRIGAEPNVSPKPRQPRLIPGKAPADFKVIRTSYGPWHPDWKKKGGDQWDNKDWSMYAEPGNPTNPNAYGGHSDALDWDRHMGHISIIWDLLLPYILTNGNLKDDNLGIPESFNDIPDLIDEAQYEVDFWLRLRDGKGGYACGLNNPDKDHKLMYQAAAKPVMAWANAANCAMMAEAYRIANRPALVAKYRDEAVAAWNFANEQDLDVSFQVGDSVVRGRDLKQMAAAFLFSITGDKKYEAVVADESVLKSGERELDKKDAHYQLYGTAGYLHVWKHNVRPIGNVTLANRMLEALQAESEQKHFLPMESRPSRRSSDESYGWFQSRQEVQRLAILHAFTDKADVKEKALKAMLLEADYGLGRNPMNMVQMTGLGRRAVEDIYTSGRNDGYPGVHPGHTPYMNAEPWGEGYMFDPKWYASKGYPSWDQWPHGEALWRARYCFANNEFTPQQTMRGKMCLLAYLYGIREKSR